MEKQQENYWHYEQRNTDKRECPKCQKQMRTEMSSIVMTSNPAQQRWYWECECGYQELGGIHVHEPVKFREPI